MTTMTKPSHPVPYLVTIASAAALLTTLAEPAAFAQGATRISDAACLRKMALDLTNEAPTDADMTAVRAGQKSLAQAADAYLGSDAYTGITYGWYRSLFRPTPAVAATADLEEPARIARYVLVGDRDMRELVRGTYTVDASGARQPAGPDAAGVLSTAYYMSAYQGLENRQWAGHLIKTLAGIRLAIVSDVPQGQDVSAAGLAANPACAGCHVHPVYGIDPLAQYRACYGADGRRVVGCATSASFLGKEGSGLPDLGATLADSEEWRASTIQMFWSKLFGRAIGKNEVAFYWGVRDAWVASGYKPKTLVKQIVTSAEYCSR